MVSEKNHNVSRRQFLTYTLTGVGGFMAAGMILPMARFAIDPVLQSAGAGDMNAVADVSELTEEPQRFDFSYEQVDGWYTSEVTETAWIYQEGDNITALSPTCTHLGCTVNWNSNESYQNQFFCPCHGGRFEKNGTNVPGTPPTEPLHKYEIEVRDGTVYLGKANPQI
ncbi:menaquinol-cytochrome c reductase iron-sulfur subunit [Alteribacillus iranensis]|uniref:Menaquinol:cytochrome c reductase iron-sulfur subunit n=1 Tax=Alteribacillus iranensis TaxID=930128 RepID=A0A1I1ZRC4_9BACI|nr:menaquinol-cytochrome c reductase iron-sulfur subunit [Alteribacillus iranensis]